MLLPEDRLANPALVVVDMQNDFVWAGAALEVAEARATILAHRALLAAFRQRDLPVAYTKFNTWLAPTLLWDMKMTMRSSLGSTQNAVLAAPPGILARGPQDVRSRRRLQTLLALRR